jgi:hypothetical protein
MNFNVSLHTAKLNNQFYRQAETSIAEDRHMNAVRRGYDVEPPKWAKRAAKQIVGDM